MATIEICELPSGDVVFYHLGHLWPLITVPDVLDVDTSDDTDHVPLAADDDADGPQSVISKAAAGDVMAAFDASPIAMISGNGGDNTLDGTSGSDEMFGGAGNDTIYGGAGADEIYGGRGVDKLFGGKGNDFIRGNEGRDRVEAGGGKDNVDGNAGNDFLLGGGGNDRIAGGKGVDKLQGDAGRDKLIGGKGADLMLGNGGVDTFIYYDISHSRKGEGNRDIIFQFKSGSDRIDLSVIDADKTQGGNQAFEFIGEAGFSSAGDLRARVSAGDIYLLGDVNGDGKADFEIKLESPGVIAEDDFIL